MFYNKKLLQKKTQKKRHSCFNFSKIFYKDSIIIFLEIFMYWIRFDPEQYWNIIGSAFYNFDFSQGLQTESTITSNFY